MSFYFSNLPRIEIATSRNLFRGKFANEIESVAAVRGGSGGPEKGSNGAVAGAAGPPGRRNQRATARSAASRLPNLLSPVASAKATAPKAAPRAQTACHPKAA